MADEQPTLREGHQVHFCGRSYRLIGLKNEAFAVLDGDDGESQTVLPLADLLAADDFQVLADDDDEPLSSTIFNGLPPKVQAKALRRLAHLRDIWPDLAIRYEDGTPARHFHRDYDPAETTVKQRLAAKMRETNWSRSRVYGYQSRYLSSGALGLVDGRRLRALTSEQFTGAALEVLEEVLAASVNRSRRPVDQIYDEVVKRLQERAAEENRKEETSEPDDASGETEPPLPTDTVTSLSSFRRRFAIFQKGRAMRGPMKYMRSAAQRPDRPFRRFRTDRAGECVVLDSSPYDVVALDPLTGLPVHFAWTVAQDQYTKAVLASRFTPKDAKGVDAALILYEMIVPKPMQPGYPEAHRWVYLGVPEQIVLDALKVDGPGIAAAPLMTPQMVTVDHGRIFVSQTFEDACAKLGIDIVLARKGRPTDKGPLERFFGSSQTSLQSRLQGFKGSDVHSRGADPEADALLFIDELRLLVDEWLIACHQQHAYTAKHLPTSTDVAFTVDRMYEESIGRWGFNYLPPPADLYYDLLPTRWVTIQGYGVQLDNLFYDSDAFNDYRDQRSPYNLIGDRKADKSGKWPIKSDPRDLSHVFFRDPKTERWHTIEWTDALAPGRAFSDLSLGYAHWLVTNSGGHRRALNRRELARVVNELIDRRINLDYLTDRKERLLAAKQRQHDDQRKRDMSHPGVTPEVPGQRDMVADLLDQVRDIDSSEIAPIGLADNLDFEGEEF